MPKPLTSPAPGTGHSPLATIHSPQINRGVTRVPRHLRITPTMLQDLLVDPVMAVYVIFGLHLDVFQAALLRIMWWVPNVIDSSGFGTGKTLRAWLVTNLRAILIPEQKLFIYYQGFSAMKLNYWTHYSNRYAHSPIFAAQKGRFAADGEEEKDNTRGAACYIQSFRNGSGIYAPAPNWLQGAKGQAGLTFHVAYIDEWTKIETMTPKSTTVMGADGNLLGGIDQQIIGRVRAPSWNQDHLLWANRFIFSATAESTQHPGYARVRQFEKEIAAGNPNFALITSCFKDFSNVRMQSEIRVEAGRLCYRVGKPFRDVVPNWNTIGMLKGRSRAYFQREGLGLWRRDAKGLYPEDALGRCVEAGVAAGTEVECVRGALAEAHYFLGVDPAAAQRDKSDDGAMVVLRLRPKPGLGRAPSSNTADWLFECVWAYRVRGQRAKPGLDEAHFFAQRAGDWSGLIHKKHSHFGLSGMMLDGQGGGLLIWPELNKTQQVIDGMQRAVTPIASRKDSSVGNAHFILAVFLKEFLEALWPVVNPGVDGLYTAAHTVCREMVEHAEVLFPKPYYERSEADLEKWSEEARWALRMLDLLRHQLSALQVATREDGSWDLTRHGAYRIMSGQKKDLAYAWLYAVVDALLWLKSSELEFMAGDEEYVGCWTQ